MLLVVIMCFYLKKVLSFLILGIGWTSYRKKILKQNNLQTSPNFIEKRFITPYFLAKTRKMLLVFVN